MIILNDEDQLERPESYGGYLALADLEMPKDILVNRKSNFLKRSGHPSTLQYKILKEGISVYGAL